MSRRATASRLAAALLATTFLTPIVVIAASVPSLADGGTASGVGGIDSLDGTGGTGGSSGTTGGGGGAGVTGGDGGSGGASPGGTGATSAGADGQSTATAGGGGGGAHGEVVSVPGAISAATGGSGGSSGSGGGGAGGYGAAVTSIGTFTQSGTVSGGSGGSGAAGGTGGVGIDFGASASHSTLNNSGLVGGGGGGQGSSSAGSGGAGIIGDFLTINNSSGATVTGGVGGDGPEAHGGSGGAGISSAFSTINNSGSITGGGGGVYGTGGGDGAAGIVGAHLTINNSSTGSITGGVGGDGPESHGAGGAGITASSTTVINSGSITGAPNDVGRANAITFTGGTNVLELQAGSTITGNVVAVSGGTDTLRLGGSTNATFDASQIGSVAQYRNFGQFEKTGTGTWTLTGTAGQTTPWTISQGTLAVNGSITGDVTVATAGTLGGNGTITGNIVNNGAIAPGNSIGTLTFSGSYTQAAGSTYQVEVNSAGQNDRINVTGAPGTATINGGTVQVVAASGSYGHTTIYTILSATGGRTGKFDGVTSNFAFLTPSLSYDADDVFLTLTLNGFTFNQLTPNQRAVGAALDQAFAGATGDFATVLGTLTGLDTVQGPKALDTISGQQYAGFATANVEGAAAFMNAIGAYMAGRHGGFGSGTHVALAEACDVACDAPQPRRFSAWASGIGGTGSVMGDFNAGGLTYNLFGTAVGVDYRVAPGLLAGVSLGYLSGTQWVDGFNGRGNTDTFSGSLYASWTSDRFYVDAVAGYAYASERMTRTIVIPGLAPRTALGNTGANQFMGQLEAGYRLDLPVPPTASITPFARLQGSTTTQNGFSEVGAQSLDLTVARQTTNSLRSTFGADLAAEIAKVAFKLRLGWQHEYADAARPVTAAFAGAPAVPFTVYGATPQRDSAVLGLAAATHVSDATEAYLRYDGEVGGGTDNHAFIAGLRLTW